MAAPNIVSATSLYGKMAYGALTTSAATMLNNAASSNKLLKVLWLRVTNIDGTNAADVTISYYTQDDIGGTAYRMAYTISVPADSAVDILERTGPIFLEEDKSIGGAASANSDIEYLIAYEEYDDA